MAAPGCEVAPCGLAAAELDGLEAPELDWFAAPVGQLWTAIRSWTPSSLFVPTAAHVTRRTHGASAPSIASRMVFFKIYRAK